MAVRLRSFADLVGAPHSKEFDRILDVAEPTLHALAAKHVLREAQIDRW